ncbi:thiamine pyrophosphate-binding protein [Sphingobium fuliginis]|uniref:Thiamine pyrophosphate-binding protein n=1 Tax=Sphingobium fuliginis ATCC 27551 TaxID=1208342 RepID=A0A5B8CGX5_SPHSA|nr:thiamine pyrophosphate-binding protein [Sphingobium fuliginis]QDC37250.1 thiamine pyrophosphate-binding protein [Sphingobium fuliginis ATCC 27551]
MASQSGGLPVHQAIARMLLANDVHTVFGLMGDANMFMIDYFIRECGGTFVAAAHEAGAATMALGFAASSGRIGVCSVTHGPAMVNTITAMAHGVKASLPMVVICGDTDTEDRYHTQNIAQREFAIAAGAGFEQLRSPRTVAEDVATAIRRAVAERRPIALNVPLEFDWRDADGFEPVKVKFPEARALVSSSDDIDNAVGIIAAAKRPIVVAGRGATSAEARNSILKLAERIEAPLATTLKGKDLFQGEAFNLGIFGTVSSPAAVDAIVESDCILAFGSSLNTKTVSAGSFLKGKRSIQVNLEPAEIAKNFRADVGLVGDPAQVADLIVHWLDEAEIPPSGFRSEELRDRLAQPEPLNPMDNGDGTVDYMRSLVELDRILPANRLIVTDVGRFMLKVWTTVHVDHPSAFVSTSDFGSIGLGMSHAIGAAFGAPDRPAVLFCGDGGFMHGGLAEFNTAVRHNADVIVVVCNDGCYGAEQVKFHYKNMDFGTIRFDWPDFVSTAVALGGEGVRVQSEADWSIAEQAIRARTKPLLIDVRFNPTRLPLF